MLNGAIIGSVDDETAIFYNPGAMAVNRETGVAISLITPSLSRYRTKNLIGDYQNIDVDNYGFAPGLVSALFNIYKRRIIGGFTSFQRYKSNINFSRRLTGEVIDDKEKFFVGDVNFSRRDREEWTGVGVAFLLSEKLSIGLTQFATLKRESLDYGFKREILSRKNPLELSEAWRYNFSYGVFAGRGILTKLGLSWHPDNYTFGLTYTSPTYYTLVSRGKYAYTDQRIVSNGKSTTRSDRTSVDLFAEHKTPWSIGLGFSTEIDLNVYHVSMEYFSRIKPYYVINHTKDPYGGLSDEKKPVTTTIEVGKRPVFNIAIGVEQYINRKFVLYYGARTDFNPSEVFLIDEDADYLGTAPSMFHLSLGTVYDYGKSRFSFGIDVGYGFKKNGPQLLDISSISRENLFEKPRQEVTDIHAYESTIFITYSL